MIVINTDSTLDKVHTNSNCDAMEQYVVSALCSVLKNIAVPLFRGIPYLSVTMTLLITMYLQTSAIALPPDHSLQLRMHQRLFVSWAVHRLTGVFTALPQTS